jgi:hypothetical protein
MKYNYVQIMKLKATINMADFERSKDIIEDLIEELTDGIFKSFQTWFALLVSCIAYVFNGTHSYKTHMLHGNENGL